MPFLHLESVSRKPVSTPIFFVSSLILARNASSTDLPFQYGKMFSRMNFVCSGVTSYGSCPLSGKVSISSLIHSQPNSGVRMAHFLYSPLVPTISSPSQMLTESSSQVSLNACAVLIICGMPSVRLNDFVQLHALSYEICGLVST